MDVLRWQHRWRVAKLRLRWAIEQRSLRPGTRAYAKHVEAETQHYAGLHDEAGLERAPASWLEVQARVPELTGDIHEAVTSRLTPGARMLSLGAGAGGLERMYALACPAASITGLELNAALVRQANATAPSNLRFDVADLNTAKLPRRDFDVAFAHASLHHLVELEHVFEQVTQTLRPGGVFIIHDVIARNGHRMWPETRRVVDELWRELPERLRVNHTAYREPRVDKSMFETDTRLYGMECLRSEEIPALLDRYFMRVEHRPYLAFARRFFDTMYGPNYDMADTHDRAIFDRIWQRDLESLTSGALRGESLFAIYRHRG